MNIWNERRRKLLTKILYDVPWYKGRVQAEVETLKELVQVAQELHSMDPQVNPITRTGGSKQAGAGYPSLSGNLTCRQAILTLLASDWGRKEHRTESELAAAMQANALYHPHGTLSSQLTTMKRKQEIHRPDKKNGSWAYIIGINGIKTSEHQDN